MDTYQYYKELRGYKWIFDLENCSIEEFNRWMKELIRLNKQSNSSEEHRNIWERWKKGITNRPEFINNLIK